MFVRLLASIHLFCISILSEFLEVRYDVERVVLIQVVPWVQYIVSMPCIVLPAESAHSGTQTRENLSKR